MAIGDAVGAIAAITNGSTAEFQPASGVEVLLTCVGYDTDDSGTTIVWGLHDGSNNAYNQSGATQLTPNTGKTGQVSITVDNNNWIKASNTSGSTKNWVYTGIVINV